MNPEALLDDVKGYLDISWKLTNEEEDKLLGMIGRGIKTLQDKIGSCDFTQESQEKSLLLDYVMYSRAGALSDFWVNYRKELLSLRLRNKVEGYGKEQTVSDIQ